MRPVAELSAISRIFREKFGVLGSQIGHRSGPSQGMQRWREITEVLADGGGVLARRQHPELAAAIATQLRAGNPCSLLPGIYCVPDVRAAFWVKVRTVSVPDPDAIFIRMTAARLSYWPERDPELVAAAIGDRRVRRPGFWFERRRIPTDLPAMNPQKFPRDGYSKTP